MSKAITIKTSWSRPDVEKELSPLKEDIRKAGVQLSIIPPDAHGFMAEFSVAIVGGVSVYLISKLIDIVVNKIVGKTPASVNITHVETNITFQLPEHKSEAIRYFKRQEGPSSSSDSLPSSENSNTDKEEATRIYIPDDFDIAQLMCNPETGASAELYDFANYNEHLETVLARGGISYEPHEAARSQLAVIIQYCRQKRIELRYSDMLKTMIQWIEEGENVNIYDIARKLIDQLKKSRK